MADQTINDPTELAVAPAVDDFLPIWDASAGQHKKIKPGNLVGLSITGGGVVATGGFVLTVPQTMIAAGRNVANTFTALQTFSNGINLGAEDLAVYNQDTWTPAVEGGTGNPTITYTTQTGKYTQIGNIVFYAFRIVINTFSGGSGNLRVTLPATVSTLGTPAAVRLSGPDLTGTPATVVFAPVSGAAYGNIMTMADNGAETIEAVTILAAGDVIQSSGFFFVA